jgi:TolA-binding protein
MLVLVRSAPFDNDIGTSRMNRQLVFLLVAAMLMPLGAVAQTAGNDSAADNTSALLTRHQQRMDILEQGLKEIRGVLEKDLRDLRLKVDQLGSSSVEAGSAQGADIKALRQDIERLSDMLVTTNRRMERTLEITSDTEFRLLRLEKRVQTLITLGGPVASDVVVQQDTMPADAPADVQMSRDSNNGVVSWSVDAKALDSALADNKEPQTIDTAVAAVDAANRQETGRQKPGDETASGQAAGLAAGRSDAGSAAAAGVAPEPVTPVAVPEVLPAVDAEEQYRFALGRALQNDLIVAEKAFAEFRQFNAGHAREADATFWLGRVQFMRGEYEKAALTFTEFNSAYPGDARLVDTTMWIAESVSHFAPPEQACMIYADLPQLLETPPAPFLEKLADLRDAAKCKS